MDTDYLIESCRASVACDAFLDALLVLHMATLRRERVGERIKPEWSIAMDRALAAADAVCRAAGIAPDNVEAFADLIAYHSMMREKRVRTSLKEEAWQQRAAWKMVHRG